MGVGRIFSAMCRPLAKIRICETIYDILLIGLPSVNYCDGLGHCFRFVCIYACAAVFFCVATVFSVTKDLYIGAYHTTHFHRDSRKMQKN